MWILTELGDALHRGRNWATFLRFLDTPGSHEDFEVVPASAELFHRGVELFRARPDREWSLTDCISPLIQSSAAESADREDVNLVHRLIHPPRNLPAAESFLTDQITAARANEAIRIEMRELCEMAEQIEHNELLAAREPDKCLRGIFTEEPRAGLHARPARLSSSRSLTFRPRSISP